MVPSEEVFFDEVRTVCDATAGELGLTGPAETGRVMPRAVYKGDGVDYRIGLDDSDGTVECSARIETDTLALTADIEALAIAAGVVEKRGGISYSARNLKQLRKSLQGQADYIRRVHPFLTDATRAENLMRQAGAREWTKGAP